MAIEVWTATDLDNVRNNLSGEYIQMADIDLSGYANWTPIGDDSNPFTGQYNHNGKFVDNMNIDVPGSGIISCFGLFGFTQGATIQNARMRNGTITTTTADIVAAGLLSGDNFYSTIFNCHAVGSVFGYFGIGGLLGGAHGTKVGRCSFVGTVESNYQDIGGLIGLTWDYGGETTEIKNCFARGSVASPAPISTTRRFGGLIGNAYDPTSLVENCYAACSVFSGSHPDDSGGLIGGVYAPESVINSYYDSDVSGRSDTGKGIPRTTAEMTYPPASNTYVSWNFDTIWKHDTDYTVNDGYPYLWAPYMFVYPKVAGAWKQAPAWIKKDGQWKSVTQGWIKEGGAWKPIIP